MSSYTMNKMSFLREAIELICLALKICPIVRRFSNSIHAATRISCISDLGQTRTSQSLLETIDGNTENTPNPQIL